MASNEDIVPSNLHSEWEEVIGHPLSDTEYQEIRDNLSAVFKLLAEWASESDGDENGVWSVENDSLSLPYMDEWHHTCQEAQAT